MPRYAAIDIGSNSVRMLAAEMQTDGRLNILAQDRQVTRLGTSVFRTGQISAEAIQLVCEILARMAQTYRRLDVAGVRAVATSAVRDAGNQQEFLEKASWVLGAPVEIISGQEEARLIHMGVQLRWPHANKKILIIDVGGGSAELIFSDKGKIRQAYSKPLGAVRLTEVFLKSDPPTKAELHRLNEYIEEKLGTPVKKIGEAKFDRVIATSATAAAIVCAVNKVPRPEREHADRMRATAAQIRKFFSEMARLGVAARRKRTGIGPRRAELIVAGAAVFARILDDFHAGSLYYSVAGVRDGIVADLWARGVGREIPAMDREQRKIVEEMARRYGVHIAHAKQVAHLAHELFQGLQPVHKLPASYGKLLEAAAYLHDIGHYVSDTSHHKHSYYLVAHSDMPGFTDSEREAIALLCRYHRKSVPGAKHAPFQAAHTDARRAVTMLAPLLRIADSLDRSHGQRVRDLKVELKNGGVVIRLDARADPELDLWAAERSTDFFRQAYKVPLTLSAMSQKA